MPIQILGLGTCIPSHKLTQQQAFDQAKDYCGGNERKLRALKRLYERSEINSRSTVMQMVPTADFFPMPSGIEDFGPTTADRMARYENEVADLALQACERAILNLETAANLNGESFRKEMIRNLVTVTCTGFSSPGFDIALIDQLGLNRNITRTQIGFMGCHGVLNGLRVANALQANLIRSKALQPNFVQPKALQETGEPSDHSNLTLLCAAEICSIHFHYGWDSDSLLANSLFADGAGAVILGDAQDSGESGKFWSILSSASHVVPDSLDAMSWKIGDNGFSMTLSAHAPNLIKLHLKEFLDSWLNSINVSREDIGAWAIHPGGARILDAVGECLNLAHTDLRFSREILQRYGNMSSPTVLFVLEEIRAELGCVPTVVLAFGPGLTIVAAFLGGAS